MTWLSEPCGSRDFQRCDMTDRTTVYTDQGKRLVLTPQMHLATGGEGSVYVQGDTVYKLYLDPVKAQRLRISDKLATLQQLARPGIAAPTGALRDKAGTFVGLTLPRVDGEALCRLYTNTWQQANQFTPKDAAAVSLAMREIVAHAHAKGAVMVDANELNWLVEGVRPTVIDVDSWQVPGFPASAIMASIRDPLASTGFTPGSDWYAWAIVTFQLWCGIHPFKGVHPDFGRTALEERMRANASVYDPRVRWPAATRPLSTIPGKLSAWYEQVFSSADRSAPPSDLSAAAKQTAPRVRIRQGAGGGSSLTQVRIGNAGGAVLAAFGDLLVARTPAGLSLWSAKTKKPIPWVTPLDCEQMLRGQAAMVTTPEVTALVRLDPAEGLYVRTETEPERLALALRGTALWQGGGRTFLWVPGVANGLVELYLGRPGDKTVLATERQWPLSALSSRSFQGCVVQDCLGTPFIAVPEGKGLVQLKAPALVGHRIVDAIALDSANVWVSAIRRTDGQAVRLHLTATASTFEAVSTDAVDGTALNGAKLSTGVGVLRLEDELRLSRGTSAKLASAGGLSVDAQLFASGAALMLYKGSEVSSLSLN